MASKALNRLKKLNTRDCLWIYVLRILKDNPSHGYTVRQDIQKRFGFRPGTVTAYKVLYDLKMAGLVAKKTDGRKRIYTITQKGKKELKEAARFYKERAKLLV